MKLTNKFNYKTLEKVTHPSGARYYVCPETNTKLPSVTTIIGYTSDNKKELLEWQERVGEKKAAQERKEALALGTLMHTHIENYIQGVPRPGGNNMVRVMAEKMADQIIKRGLHNVSDVYGSEVCLYYPGLYAGTCDVLANVVTPDKREIFSILDFKTAKKIRSRDMITDYLLQMGAYSIAQRELFGVEVQQAIILMVSREYDFEKFVLEKNELKKYELEFLNKVDQYFSLDKLPHICAD